ncbi:MAG: AAA family ATPase [Candidatus Bathyarchaeota archaeon]
MWTEKYRPKNISEVIGNEEAKIQFIEWLKNWKLGVKPIMLYGPPGVGKTTLVKAVSLDYSYDLIEMNASDARTEETVVKVAGHASTNVSLFGFISDSKGTLLLLDEVDGIQGREDKGGVGAVIKIIEQSKIPVVLTANDPSSPKLRDLKAHCQMIRFYGVRPPVLIAFLERICGYERITVEPEALEYI